MSRIPPEFDDAINELWRSIVLIHKEHFPSKAEPRLYPRRRYDLQHIRSHATDAEIVNGFRFFAVSPTCEFTRNNCASVIDYFLREWPVYVDAARSLEGSDRPIPEESEFLKKLNSWKED